MCGKMRSELKLRSIVAKYRISQRLGDLSGLPSAAVPGTLVPIVSQRRADLQRVLSTIEWGVPRAGGELVKNARLDKFASEFWREDFATHRVVIPAVSFWEGNQEFQPSFLAGTDGVLNIAGMLKKVDDHWKAVVITRQADSVVSAYHHRMPVLLPSSMIDEWLDTSCPIEYDMINTLARLPGNLCCV